MEILGARCPYKVAKREWLEGFVIKTNPNMFRKYNKILFIVCSYPFIN